MRCSMILRISVFLCLCQSVWLNAQTLPYTKLYDDNLLSSIYITLPADSLEELYNNLENELEYHASFVFDDGSSSDTLENIGFRLRGNTSLGSAKKSFKVSFNTYEPGRKYEGVEKLNLIGMHNDPTMVREHLYFETYNALGLPEHRSNFVRLYINGDYYGLYTNMEHIDEVFVGNRFGNDQGNLFKCTWGADLQWRGDNPDEYINHGYELHINDDTDNIGDLIHFIDVLNNTPDAEFMCAIEEVFNVQGFLQTYALDISTGHWDNYGGNQNNYYLYQNLSSGKFEFLSFDADNSFGVDWLGFDWTEKDVYDWPTGWYTLPLISRLLSFDTYRAQFSYYLTDMIQHALDPALVESQVLAWRTLIAEAALEDEYRTYDWGYTYDDFWNGFTENGIDGHTPYGITPFAELRALSTSIQTETTPLPPIVRYLETNPMLPSAGGTCSLITSVIDDGSISSVTLEYKYTYGGPSFTTPLFDDGLHNDAAAGDGIYATSISIGSSVTAIFYKIIVTDNEGLSTNYPYCDDYTELTLFTNNINMVINEVMSANTTVLADESGDYDDYIELFNAGATTISLYGYFLSDDPTQPWKWRLPDLVVQPGAYLLIWADDETEAGSFHTNFTLDNDGEWLGLYSPAGMLYAPVDTLHMPALGNDQSWGRLPNGSGAFTMLPYPSPGANNQVDTAAHDLNLPVLVGNPSTGYSSLWFEADGISYYEVQLTDMNGRNMGMLYSGIPMEGMTAADFQTEKLSPGVYYVQLVTAHFSQSFPLVKI
jgi:spore coat protein H